MTRSGLLGVKPLLLTENFKRGTPDREVVLVVIHVMEGTMAGTLSWFRNPRSRVSAHYGISRAGEIVQYVSENDVAWHAGKAVRPSAALVKERAGDNPNNYSIGIENEGTGRSVATEEQLDANARLLKDIVSRHPGVKLDRRHVVGHREIRADKTCPGKIDVDEILRRATL